MLSSHLSKFKAEQIHWLYLICNGQSHEGSAKVNKYIFIIKKYLLYNIKVLKQMTLIVLTICITFSKENLVRSVML